MKFSKFKFQTIPEKLPGHSRAKQKTHFGLESSKHKIITVCHESGRVHKDYYPRRFDKKVFFVHVYLLKHFETFLGVCQKDNIITWGWGGRTK